MRFGPMEIALVLVIILIVFGAGKLPEVGGAIGKAMRSFRQESRGGEDETGKKLPVNKVVTRNATEINTKSDID